MEFKDNKMTIKTEIDSDVATNAIPFGECPICNKTFPLTLIEIHADKCIQEGAIEERKKRMSNAEKPTTLLMTTRATKKARLFNNNNSLRNYTTDNDNINDDNCGMGTDDGRAQLLTCSASEQTRMSISNHSSANSDRQKPQSFFQTVSTCNQSSGIDCSSNNNVQLKKNVKVDFKPLAEQMRPSNLNEFVGQNHILAQGSMLRTLIECKEFPSMILWGPPGCGKTSLAKIISSMCQCLDNFNFVTLSATNSGVNDIKTFVMRAHNEQTLLKRKTVLFIDEIHRFNKLQQDSFLPHVENGTITLIGATTENPSFSLNAPLLSRCRVFVLNKLDVDAVINILVRSVEKLEFTIIESATSIQEYGNLNNKFIETAALKNLAELSDGDARIALNCLSLACKFETLNQEETENCHQPFVVTSEHIRESLQRTHLMYDRKGDEHFNCISALHKSMRGGDANAALYWLGRILEGGEDPRYVSRRLIRFASEDVGLADPLALNQAVATHEACQFIGMPECDVVLAQCVVYLSEAEKSVRVYDAYKRVKECITSHKGPLPNVPLHLRNATTKLQRQLGYGNGYIYNPHNTGQVNQVYLPDDLEDANFLDDPAN